MRLRSALVSGLAALSLVLPTLPAGAANSTFATLVAYDKAHQICQGVKLVAAGSQVSAASRQAGITDVFSCETQYVLTFIDVFSSTAARVAITSKPGFITQAICAAKHYTCGIDYNANWVFIALEATKPGPSPATDEATIKRDQQLMSPSLVKA